MENEVSLADVLRTGLDGYLAKYGPLPYHYYKVINALLSCKTARLGAHAYQCPECEYRQIAYNSCRNRHCPACQGVSGAHWADKRVGDILPVTYFHIVFTIPRELNPVALRNRKAFYNLFFRAASETLTELAANRKRLGAKIGFFAVLHTWGQNLLDHPHIHCVVPGGGISKDNRRWKASRKNYLFPVKVMSRLFKGKLLAYLKNAVSIGDITFRGQLHDLNRPDRFRSFISGLYAREWVVYTKPPFATPVQVIKYLSRYTHKIAIANRRILKMENGRISFSWKNYRDGNKRKTMTLETTEFIRRFLLHVLPTGFMRIRHYGILGNRIKSYTVGLCRKLLKNTVGMRAFLPVKLKGIKPLLCPHCHKTVLRFQLLPAGVWPGG